MCMFDCSPEITILFISSRPIGKKKRESLKFEKKMTSGIYDIGR